MQPQSVPGKRWLTLRPSLESAQYLLVLSPRPQQESPLQVEFARQAKEVPHWPASLPCLQWLLSRSFFVS